jgi:thioredoxin 1
MFLIFWPQRHSEEAVQGGFADMSDQVMAVTDANFQGEVLGSDKPVLVDFWAAWCGPCRAIGPVVEELAGEYADKIKFGKCNVDENPVTPGKYSIRAIPTLILFKGGQVFEQITGAVSKSVLEEAVKRLIQ